VEAESQIDSNVLAKLLRSLGGSLRHLIIHIDSSRAFLQLSPRIQALVGEVEHFPWEVVNNLMKASPHMLQSVEVALRLLRETDPDWGITTPLSPGEYEGYFYQFRSALPGLDKKLIMSIASQAVRHFLLCLLLGSHPYYHQLSQCRIYLMWWYVMK